MKGWLLMGLLAAVALALGIVTLTGGTNDDVRPAPQATDGQAASAVFAGGCFWCVEEAFDGVQGVISTTSGYTGGRVPNPTYEQVARGGTGHYEAVRVIYDPGQVSYETLLQTFWRNIDPTDAGGQFCDRGDSYRAAIFYATDAQKRLAIGSKQALDESRPFEGEIVTEILPATEFYPAEEYHQDYYTKNPLRYKYYKWSCGRAQRLEELWG
jgi:methionine-S-sulfoxide reductase